MSRKKPEKGFRNNPFKKLPGISVARSVDSPKQKQQVDSVPDVVEADFYTQMSQLGVTPLEPGSAPGPVKPSAEPTELPVLEVPAKQEELFLQALGSLDVRFQDELPDPPPPARQPRRMRQLRQGRLPIDARLDLHGLTRIEALGKVGHFLDNAWFHQLRTVLIVTGKGAHSTDGPVLRTSLEAYLQANSHPAVVEWGRAPREHGGEGVLVVFLRRSSD